MTSSGPIAYADPEPRLRRLLRRLPNRMQAITRWLRKPASRWARLPAGIFLIIGGCLAILPVFGLWMLPLGLCCWPTTSRRCGGSAIACSTGSSGAGQTGSPRPGPRRRKGDAPFAKAPCRKSEIRSTLGPSIIHRPHVRTASSGPGRFSYQGKTTRKNFSEVLRNLLKSLDLDERIKEMKIQPPYSGSL